jgi:hypothetical protein
MKLLSKIKTGLLMTSVGLVFFITTPASAYYEEPFLKSCLTQCLNTVCRQKNTSPRCFQKSYSRVFHSVENEFCRGMPGSVYNPMAITTKPSCLIDLNALTECQQSCRIGSN